MNIVVFGGQRETDEVIDHLFDLLTDEANYPYFYDTVSETTNEQAVQEGVPTGAGDLKPTTGSHPGQSDKTDFFRILIKFQGIAHPTEIKFQTLKSYIADQVEVGKYDPRKGEFSGRSYEMYNIGREMPIADILFPEVIYPELAGPSADKTRPFPPLVAKKRELLINSNPATFY